MKELSQLIYLLVNLFLNVPNNLQENVQVYYVMNLMYFLKISFKFLYRNVLEAYQCLLQTAIPVV